MLNISIPQFTLYTRQVLLWYAYFRKYLETSIESGNTYNARVELFYAIIRDMDCRAEVEPMLDTTIIPLPAEDLSLANTDHEDSRITALI